MGRALSAVDVGEAVSVTSIRERWLTFEEAAEELREVYGLQTSAQSLKKLSNAGRAMPSKLNFGKRQVRISAILPWLKANGYIEQ